MESIPTHVQIGPYTYCVVRHSKTENPLDCITNQSNQTISLAATLTPQREAASLLRGVFQIIFEMMGNDTEKACGFSREFAAIFCGTLGSSPEIFAWSMAGLLEDREDRKPSKIKESYDED